MAQIKVQREKNLTASGVEIKILLDGKEIGRVANGDVVEFQIPAGTHQLSCRQGVATFSDICSFTIAENETKSFNVNYWTQKLAWAVVSTVFVIAGSTSFWLTGGRPIIKFICYFILLLVVLIFLLKFIKILRISVKVVNFS